LKRKPLEDIAGTLPVAACKFFKFDFMLVAEWPAVMFSFPVVYVIHLLNVLV
jgi:hypothetical protein